MIAKSLVVGGILLVIEPVLAAASFSNTITLGSIVLGVIVLIIAGVFTIRSNVAKIWREEAEGQRQKAERLAAELAGTKLAAVEEKRVFEAEQQEIRHALKDELAGVKAQLAVEQAKPDLSALMQRLADQHEETINTLALEARAAVAEASVQTRHVAGVVDEVHGLVNSRKEALEQQVKELQADMRERDLRIATLEERLKKEDT